MRVLSGIRLKVVINTDAVMNTPIKSPTVDVMTPVLALFGAFFPLRELSIPRMHPTAPTGTANMENIALIPNPRDIKPHMAEPFAKELFVPIGFSGVP